MNKKIITAIALSSVLASSLYSADKLNDVIVTAKSNVNSLDTAGTFTVITNKDIQESHATNVQDLLEESTGVTLTTSKDGRKRVSIRGLDSSFTLVLVNGKKVSNVDHQISYADFSFDFVSLDMIERIEIGKGPMSTLYGSGAIGGVINIITKKPTDKLSGSINIEGGGSSGEGGSESAISANLSKKITDKLFLSLAASKKKTAIIVDEETQSDTLFEGRNTTNISFDSKYDIDDTQSISASFLKSKDTRDTYTDDNYYETENKQYSMDYSKNFEDISLDIKGYRTETESHTTFSNGFTHELVNDTLNIETSLDVFDDNFIVVGAEGIKGSYKQIDDGSTSAVFDKTAKQKALYVQDDINLNDKTVLSLGLRYDNHENYDSELSPKAYLTYSLSENSRIKGGYAEGFLAPTISQGSSEYQAIRKPGGPTLVFNGNDELKTQTAKTYELGYEYKNNDLSFKSTLFYNDIKNFIDTITTSSGFVPGTGFVINRQYQNVSNAKTKGLELEIGKKNILYNLNVFAGYTYLKTENTDTNKELNMKPKHKINAKVEYTLPADIKSILKYQLYGNQYNEDKDKTLGSYSLVDFSLSKKIDNKITIKTGINNLFNKKLDNSEEGYSYALNPRFYYVGLNYQF